MSKKQIKLVDFGEPQQFKINRSKPKRIVKTANYKEPEKEKAVPPKGKRPKIKMVNFEKKKPKFKVVGKSKLKAKPKKITLPELKAITGLSKAEANKLKPEELFGLLPKELSQMVLQPSKRGGGVKLGHINIKDFTLDDFEDIKPDYLRNSVTNTNESMMFNQDFTDVLTAREDKFYLKNYSDFIGGNLSDKILFKMETLEEKIEENTFKLLLKEMKTEFKKWKTKNKGMTGTKKTLAKSFEEFY